MIGHNIELSEGLNENQLSDNFDTLYYVDDKGKLYPRDIRDLSTEDWQLIQKAVFKLGYTDITSAKIAKDIYSKYVEKNGFNKEQSDAIISLYKPTPKSTELGIASLYINKAKKYFKTTTNFSEAGYLLPDGSMLDFSGKRFGGTGNMRVMDHREINAIFDDIDLDSNTAYMNKFISFGAIRLIPTQGVTIGEIEPTAKQYSVLSRYIDFIINKYDEFYLDLQNDFGNTLFSRTYTDSYKPVQIINDIKYYFKNDVLPERNDLEDFL